MKVVRIPAGRFVMGDPNGEADERPALHSPHWMQYMLDNCSSVKEVVAADSQVRIFETVDHYLVADRTGDCAVIECDAYAPSLMLPSIEILMMRGGRIWAEYAYYYDGDLPVYPLPAERPAAPAATRATVCAPVALTRNAVSGSRAQPSTLVYAAQWMTAGGHCLPPDRRGAHLHGAGRVVG